MKKIIKAMAGVCAAGVFLLLALITYIEYLLPEQFLVEQGEEFYINDKLSLVPGEERQLSPKVVDKAGRVYTLNIYLTQPKIQEAISHGERQMVVPGGSPFGIKMYTDGVMVVGMSDIQMGAKNVNPAKEAGLKIGDIITYIGPKKMERCGDVKDAFALSQGRSLAVGVRRGFDEFEIEVQPVLSEFDNAYKAGIWVRDSSAGIGTMTYYDPETLSFGGLGHAVCDVDTGALMPLSTGEIVDVNISGVNAGMSGKPGELKGTFTGDVMGTLQSNCEAGLFGTLSAPILATDPIPMSYRQEVQPGPAVILSTISGNKPQSFEVVIEKVNYSDISPTKNMVIRVVDQRLLSTTGGIVQGMSGSPIIQDGKLVGAVTHVFVNDPTKGYGIFAENMDKQRKTVEMYRNAA